MFEKSREDYLEMIEKEKKMMFVNGFTIISETSNDKILIEGSTAYTFETKTYFLNEKWEKVFDKSFSAAYPFYSYDLAVIAEKNKNGNLLYGVIDNKGEYVIEPKFKFMNQYFDEERTIRVSDEAGKYGFINTEGEWVIEPKYKFAFDFNEHGMALAFANDYKALVSRDGEEIRIPEKYDVTLDCSDGIYITRNKETGLFGFIGGKDASVIFECKAESVEPFVNGYAVITLYGDMETWIDKEGNILSEPIYKSVSNFNEYGIAFAKDWEGKRVFLNTEGEVLAEVNDGYEVASHIGHNLYKMAKDGKYYIMNSKGEKIVDLGFSSISVGFKDGLLLCGDGKENFFLNTKAEIVFSRKNEGNNSIGEFYNSIAWYMQYSKEITKHYLFLDKSGKTIFEGDFAEVSNFSEDGYSLVKILNSDGYLTEAVIDKEGNMVYVAENTNIKIRNVYPTYILDS